MAQAVQEQNTQDQLNQALQAAWAQMTEQPQSSLHPMATAGSLPPPPTLPIQSTTAPKKSNSKGTATSMNKLSLFAVSLALMLSGALTFLSGVLLGLWLAGPSTSPAPTNQVSAVSLSAPHEEQQNSIQANSSPQQVQPSNYARAMGMATGGVIASAPTPDVPSFLKPLVKATQNAIGQQVGSKVQNTISHHVPPPPSSSKHSAPSSPPSSQHNALSSGAPTSSPSQSSAPPTSKEESSAASPDKSLSSTKTGDGDYTVQLGAYAAKDNAIALVNHLQGLSLPSQVVEGKSSEGGSLYYVHSGLYKDYSMALEAATQFASGSIPGAVVAKVTQQK